MKPPKPNPTEKLTMPASVPLKTNERASFDRLQKKGKK